MVFSSICEELMIYGYVCRSVLLPATVAFLAVDVNQNVFEELKRLSRSLSHQHTGSFI